MCSLLSLAPQYMGFLSLSARDYILEPSQALSTIHQMASVHFNLGSNISLQVQ